MKILIDQISISAITRQQQHDAHGKALDETGFWGRQGAGCIFLAKSTGRLLIAHRSRDVQEPNTWGTWGGAVDDGENPRTCVKREIEEESGYNGKLRLIALSIFSDKASGFRYFNFLAVVAEEFEPNLDWETQGYKWVALGDWPKPLHRGLQLMLDQPKNIQIIKNQISGVQ